MSKCRYCGNENNGKWEHYSVFCCKECEDADRTQNKRFKEVYKKADYQMKRMAERLFKKTVSAGE